MKVYKRVTFDIETGRVLDSQSYDYFGPVARCGGDSGGSGGAEVYERQRPEEQGAFSLSTALLQQLLQNMGLRIAGPAGAKAGTGGTTGGGANLEEIQREIARLENKENLNNRDRTRLRELEAQLQAGGGGGGGGGDGGGAVSGMMGGLGLERIGGEEGGGGRDQGIFNASLGILEQGLGLGKDPSANVVPAHLEALINQIYQSQTTDAEQSLRRFGAELAGSRGLNLSDTPIAQPLLQELGNVQRGLGAARAQSLLSERGNELARAQALREFQENLNQLKNFSNLNTLLTQSTNLGLGLYQPRFRGGVGGQAPAGGGVLQGVGSVLGGLGTLGTGIGAMGGLSGLFGGAAGAGAAATGVGSAAAGLGAGGGLLSLFLSSEKLKDDIIELEEDEYEEILDEIEDMPIKRWRYKKGLGLDDERMHIGPTVEDSPEQMVMGEGLGLDLIDYLGTTLAAVKGLAKKVERLEEGLGL